MYHLPLGELVSKAVSWLLNNYGWLFDAFSLSLGAVIQTLKLSLTGLPWWLVILFIGLGAWRVGGWRLALGSGLGLLADL